MVKIDPLPGLRLAGILFILLGVFAEIWLLFNSPTLPTFLGFLLFVILGSALFWYVAPWAQIEERRQCAALQEGIPVPLATEQPAPDETALTLTYTIKLYPKWTIPIICFLIVTPLSSGALLWLVYAPPNAQPEPSWLPFAVIGVSIFWSALVASLFPLLGWRRINISEKGIKVQECSIPSIGCNQRTIKWSEVRLFAIYPIRKHADLPVYYELASETTIVRWKRMRPDMRPRLSKMPAPFEEYDRQMDALLFVIAAKTGLPLYDLR